MNFKELYEKVLAGTATEEEKEFVLEEIAKAKEVTDFILDNKEKNFIAETKSEDVKKIKKTIRFKTIFLPIIITITAMVVLIIVGVGTIFLVGNKHARSNINYTDDKIKELALSFVVENYKVEGVTPIIKDIDKGLVLKSPLKDSRYIFDVEVQNGFDYEIELKIDCRSGEVRLDGIDKD